MQESGSSPVQHPLSKDLLPENVEILQTKSGWAYVIGTAHVSKVSADHVRDIIQLVKPNTVMVELCRSRVGILLQAEKKDNSSPPAEENTWKQLGSSVRSGKGFQILHSMLSNAVKSMTKDLDIQAGAEFKIAVHEGVKLRSQIMLGDRPIEITLKRTWAKLGVFEKLKMFVGIVYVLLVGFKISEEDIEKLKSGDIISEMMEEMAHHYPATLETIVKERDLYLASSLMNCPGETVVGVVGLGHLKGIVEHWNDDIDRRELLTVPEDKASKILKIGLAVTAAATAVVIGCVVKWWFF